jgi:hypothetical protein
MNEINGIFNDELRLFILKFDKDISETFINVFNLSSNEYNQIHVKSKSKVSHIIVAENVSQNDEILIQINEEFKVYNLQHLNPSTISTQLQDQTKTQNQVSFEGIESMVKIFMPSKSQHHPQPPSMKITRKLS